MNITYPKLKLNRTNVSNAVPTIPSSNDHTDGTWLTTDIYEGELFLNLADNKLFTRVGSTIKLINNNVVDVELTGTPATTLTVTFLDGSTINVDLSSLGSLFGGLINKTYSELVDMIVNEELVPGQLYKMTDYKTVGNIIDETGVVTGGLFNGTTEPLILLATSTNTFDKQAYSTLYPQDIIYYDITGGDTRDIAFFNSGVAINGLKGIIYYRKDTVQNVECWYDFRNVKYSRNEALYYTFGNYYNRVNNVHIGKVYLDYVIYNYGYSTRLNNMVFNTINDSQTCHSNTFGTNCFKNTIGNYFYNNTIENEFHSNTIGNNFYHNTIGNNFYYNTIGYGFSYNTIGRDFNHNTIGNNFYSNTIGLLFYSNTIGNNFQANTIGNNFGSNTIGNTFKFNDFKYCPTLTNFTSSTHVYGDYNCDIIKNSNGVLRLKYMDVDDNDVIVDITA